MLQISAGDWLIEVDTEATKSYYETATSWLCDCAYCRNFVAAYPDRFPGDFLDFLQRMSIDPLKPAQISEFGRNKDSFHVYSGNYDFVGVVEKESTLPLILGDRFCIHDVPSYAPHINIRFTVELPWLINEESGTRINL